MKKNICDFTSQEISNYLNGLGEPVFRVKQIWQGLYKNLWPDFSHFTVLPPSLIRKLIDTFEVQALTPTRSLRSNDGQTIKTLFKLQDENYIETVLMSYDKRKTLCISTQVGCAMGCVFCATGQMGFKRHLTSGEIVSQVLHYARLLKEEKECVSNVVLMGMGEPFHNYAHTLAAVDRLNDNSGFNLGARRFTISTVGLVPEIHRFAAEKRQVNLAISLHAAEDELRSSMLPINRKYPLKDLLSACREYTNITGRRVSFEWALINGQNDSPAQARLLAKILKGLLCHVNAIPLNPTTDYHGQAASAERVKHFVSALSESGIPCTLRLRRGMDISAGCGQLASIVNTN